MKNQWLKGVTNRLARLLLYPSSASATARRVVSV